MSEILNAVKNLYDFKFRQPQQIFLPEIEKIKAELERKVDVVKPPPKFELEKIFNKWKSGDKNFSRREIKSLPFIIYDSRISINEVAEIFKMLDFSKERHLKNIITAYLLNYDKSDKTRFLQRNIPAAFKNSNENFSYRSKTLKEISQKREFIFSDNCMLNMSRLYSNKQSISEVLVSIGLSDFYKSSNFIQESLKYFFITSVVALSAKLKILDAINAEADIYQNIFPAVADALIKSVANCRNFEEMNRDKRKCIEVFYKNLGDPRFGYKSFRWNNISAESKNIFLRWLAENDLDLFFKIIEQTALDRMWSYRKKFWKSYLPHISNTWVFLGKDAQYTAKNLGDKVMHYGKLLKGESKQSVLVFQIGDYIFTEWSHNGKLRVYHQHNANKFFGAEFIDRFDIIYSRYIEEWIHSSPSTYSWQNKVGSWLYEKCGIYKTKQDWE